VVQFRLHGVVPAGLGVATGPTTTQAFWEFTTAGQLPVSPFEQLFSKANAIVTNVTTGLNTATAIRPADGRGVSPVANRQPVNAIIFGDRVFDSELFRKIYALNIWQWQSHWRPSHDFIRYL
jgi:hypothetical protein